ERFEEAPCDIPLPQHRRRQLHRRLWNGNHAGRLTHRLTEFSDQLGSGDVFAITNEESAVRRLRMRHARNEKVDEIVSRDEAAASRLAHLVNPCGGVYDCTRAVERLAPVRRGAEIR